MLAYAANQTRTAGRAGSPKALTFIIAGHAALIAAVMMAKMDIIPVDHAPITKWINVPLDPSPPASDPLPPRTETKSTETVIQDPVIDELDPVVDMGQQGEIKVATGPDFPPISPVRDYVAPDPPRHDPIKLGPRFATAANAIRPSYPLDKIRLQEEATLKLRLTIDARGRVTAVDPVGAADSSFLEAARRHILRTWRYKPATEDGVAVPSSTVISLSFRLEDA